MYLILMGLFLCFDIFNQFCFLAKCFVNTCKTYKFAKLKTSSLQNCIIQNDNVLIHFGIGRNFNKSIYEYTSVCRSGNVITVCKYGKSSCHSDCFIIPGMAN